MTDEMSVKWIIRQIAKENGVTPGEVEADMKEAIRDAMTSPDPKARAFWSELAPDGKEPSLEKVLTAIVTKVKNDEEPFDE